MVFIKSSFIIQLDGKDKVLTLEKFVYEGDDYTETINIKLTNTAIKRCIRNLFI